MINFRTICSQKKHRNKQKILFTNECVLINTIVVIILKIPIFSTLHNVYQIVNKKL